jgi:pimeloyl-ACP methyl ester carboxylesterase
MTGIRIGLSWTIVLGIVVGAGADDPGTLERGASAKPKLSERIPAVESATAWTDQYFFREWRIQQHVDSHECRLLDEDNEALATGSFEECLAQLTQIKREQNLEPMRGKAVLLLHGLAAPRWSMQLLGRHLQKEYGYYPFVVEYASTRSTIDDQARGLANVIKSLEGIDEVHLVGHSMGNIVIRRYLAGDNSAVNGWRPDARIGRIVMIAPPNHGSITANRLSEFSLFQKLLGESGRQLGKGWKDLETRLATPKVEFGIIAGGFGTRIGLSLTVPGDDDGRISVETTRLAGATDFIVVSAIHEFIANDPRVLGLTGQFLAEGYFKSPEQMQGIPRTPLAERSANPTR